MNKKEYCFADPDGNNVIDLVTPDQKTGVFSKMSIADLEKETPAGRVMELAEWCKIKSARQNTPVEWLESTEESYDEALGCLPPVAYSSSGFLVGEPYDHDALTGKPRFQAYRFNGFDHFKSSRPMTIQEFKQS